MTAADQRALIRAYQTTSASLTDRLTSLLSAHWRNLVAWRDGDASVFVQQILPIVEGVAAQQATLTDAYLTRLIGDQLGQPLTPQGVRPPSIADLRGVPGVEVYTRPFVTTRAAIGDGFSLAEAAQRGLTRLLAISRTDMQLARRKTAHATMAAEKRVVGYRRVLGGGRSCPLCVIASTQRYHKEALLPIHTKCSCTVAAIVGNEDPGQVINQPLLDSTHAAIAEQFGTDAVDFSAKSTTYRTPQLLQVYDHGEMGPTLALADQNPTIL